MPILYAGDPQWRGNLISQDTGEKLMTSVPMHLEFIRKRKNANEKHFAQVVRLLKFWSKLPQAGRRVPLQVLHDRADGRASRRSRHRAGRLSARDGGDLRVPGNDEFGTAIAFSDYYNPKPARSRNDPVRIWDPVNCENNVAELYTTANETRSSRRRSMPATPSRRAAGDHQGRDRALLAESLRVHLQCMRCTMSSYRRPQPKLSRSRMPGTSLAGGDRSAALPGSLRVADRQWIDEYEKELAELLKHDVLDDVEYGFKRNGKWTEASVRYRRVPGGTLVADDDPGKIRPGSMSPAHRSPRFLTYNARLVPQSQAERAAIAAQRPFHARHRPSHPSERGHWAQDLNYIGRRPGVGPATARG